MERIPNRIEKNDAESMRIEWNSGGSFIVPFLDLRFECPCASCVNEVTGERMLKRESLDPKVRPLEVNLIGRYAIKIDWSDGHSTGMYTFDRMYEICQRGKENAQSQ